jgi:hypothetical protein
MVYEIEYTSAPLLQATTATSTVEPARFASSKRTSKSNSGRFRKKNVPKYCLRADRN